MSQAATSRKRKRGVLAGSEQYKWLEQLTSPAMKEFSVWPVTALLNNKDSDAKKLEKVEAFFPPCAVIAAIYTHLVNPPQEDQPEEHTLSHCVVFTMFLSKALRMTTAEMELLGSPIVQNGAVCYGGPGGNWEGCPYHYHHCVPHPTRGWDLCMPIGEHADWFLLFKMFPEIFQGSLTVSVGEEEEEEGDLEECCRWACERGEFRMVKFLLSLRNQQQIGAVEVPLVDIDSGLLFHLACGSGNPAIVRHFLSLGVNVMRPAWEDGVCGLHTAFDNADTEILSILLEVPGCNANIKDAVGSTPLHFAVSKGRIGAIQMLVNAGYNVDAVDDCQSTALHYASKGNYKGAIEALLKCGACVNMKDNEGRTPLALATARDCRATLRAAKGTL